MRTTPWLVAGSLVLFACSGGGGSGDATPTPTATPTATPTPALACGTARSTLVHVFDDAGRLHSFDPVLVGSAGAFTLIGTPACAPGTALPGLGGGAAIPYAFAVDDSDEAWVLYTSGQIFRVSTLDASCTATTFTPQQTTGGTTWSVFGMAFVTDTAGGLAERIWISGGATDGSLGELGSVDPGTLAISHVGAIGGSAPNHPELMGLSDATLWGFFPDAGAAFVQEIDQASGALLGSPAPIAIGGGDTLVAWGAAHWGGDFWLFLSTTDGLTTNSTIRTVDRATGGEGIVAQNLPLTIVAAASSTCAPLE